MHGSVAHGSKMMKNTLHKCPPCSTKVKRGLVQLRIKFQPYLFTSLPENEGAVINKIMIMGFPHSASTFIVTQQAFF